MSCYFANRQTEGRTDRQTVNAANTGQRNKCPFNFKMDSVIPRQPFRCHIFQNNSSSINPATKAVIHHTQTLKYKNVSEQELRLDKAYEGEF